MDHFTSDWTAAENKAFEEALAEVDLKSSNWFENLTERFPNRTAEQLRNHYMDLVLDIERIRLGFVPKPICMYLETEDLSVLDLPYSTEFSEAGSMSGPENTVEGEDLLTQNKKENKAMLPEETMGESFFLPIDEGLVQESSREQVVEQMIPTSENEGLEILLPEISETDQAWLLETEEAEMVLPEPVSEAQGRKNVRNELTDVKAGKVAGKLETSSSRKRKFRKLWSEEEHRLFLMGLNIHGRGAWRSIAKNFVHTRTPTQVASHAQKYYKRQVDQRQMRRHSILDITTIPETTKPHRVSMYNLVNSNSQTHLNNVRQRSASSMPTPEVDIQMGTK